MPTPTPTPFWNGIVPGCVSDGVAKINCIPAVLWLVIQSLLLFAGVVALFFIIHSGLKFVLSSGDPKRVEDARETFVYAIVGLVIVLLAFLILNLVSYITGVNCIEFIGFECL